MPCLVISIYAALSIPNHKLSRFFLSRCFHLNKRKQMAIHFKVVDDFYIAKVERLYILSLHQIQLQYELIKVLQVHVAIALLIVVARCGHCEVRILRLLVLDKLDQVRFVEILDIIGIPHVELLAFLRKHLVDKAEAIDILGRHIHAHNRRLFILGSKLIVEVQRIANDESQAQRRRHLLATPSQLVESQRRRAIQCHIKRLASIQQVIGRRVQLHSVRRTQDPLVFRDKRKLLHSQ
mmetsp:Transcript_7962/g.13059  ORF Transcript_7962/g.13059 Transcript_7962/m.13059 type:complete len:237 (-) Transcript_7962:818-1528(-)